MNQEILENLLIDRSLGQLSPDVAALLDDYLVHNPAAAQLAATFDDTFDDTIALAGSVLKESTPAIQPPPRCNVVPYPSRTRLTLAMAASFTVGIGVALLTLQGFRPASVSSSQSPIVEQQPSAPKTFPMPASYVHASHEARSLPFWSRERAYLLARNSEALRQ